MNCKVEKSKLSGVLVCPPNKSYTHRAIFLASLVNGKSIIKNVLRSRDTNATIEICKSLGAEIQEAGSNLKVKGIDKFDDEDLTLDASNSGTTIRIAAAISAVRDGKTILTGDESLKKRPMKQLTDALESLGARCESNDGKPPLTVIGKIKGGEITIPGNISSQFISALFIVAPRTEIGITVNISSELVSKPYLDATISTMKKFGVEVEVIEQYKKYRIEPQEYKHGTVTIPSDFSSVALLLSAAVLVGDGFTVKISIGDLAQGDEAIIDILEKLGVNISMHNNTIKVKAPEKLLGGKFDLSNTPDLLPPLSILALKSGFPIELYNVKHARYKETDRIAILARELQKIGIKVTEKEDGLILGPPDKVSGAMLNSEDDHRLFMAFCIAGMYVGDCTVSNPESVDVSYPSFISDMNHVGAKITTV
ncbi:3-phosphoshikimate 1-carboxyvinyltransferase [Candidatus Nitrosotenuis sp. DW1]|uniref:3-phosphoshikimate 1-carboxyvinyltransferase n=1 Tax=Candidatus Nitrosotenuis sp. DW1 TaxID=2259672 RepID=UPI0015CCBDCA|nr:3-phosphoshikimate 1-carboxyvinyltransferase [Candidatus Nitrosotenuis sp. DW1]QLH09904.1 3-phosphoshikimate 1-carboxyvinyltransferase [Candidatus Nitrosotenuis sp. DW1]